MFRILQFRLTMFIEDVLWVLQIYKEEKAHIKSEHIKSLKNHIQISKGIGKYIKPWNHKND